jgi:glycosyltransferase involved in cell wall biosynthesis
MLSNRHKPRILHLSQPTTGGTAVCVRALASFGAQHGYMVTVACPDGGELPGWTAEAGGAWLPLPLTRSPGLADSAHLVALRTLIRGTDVLHLHASKAGALGRLALLGMSPTERPACIFTPHGWSWLVGGPLAPAYRRFERAAARLADVIVAVSDEDRRVGAGVLGVDAARIRVIPNGVDTRLFGPDGPRAERSTSPLIVCIGRFDIAKGQDIALHALARMRTLDARLRLVGDGPDRGALLELAHRLGIADRVEMTGFDAAPARHMRAADIVLVPSRWDAQSLVLLEAMACGRPVVATKVPGVEALDGVGAVVPREDPDGIARVLDDLLADPFGRDRMGGAARGRAVAKLDLRRCMDRYRILWDALLRRRGLAHPFQLLPTPAHKSPEPAGAPAGVA